MDYARIVASSRAQEHSNIHQSRTRVLRIFTARTWVNDPCADYQTRSLHNPAPVNRRRDTSDPIGVVPTDIFGAPGRGRSCGNLVWLGKWLHRGRHSKEEDDQTGGVACGCGERPRNDRKPNSREISVIFTYIRFFSPRDLVLCTGNLHAMGPFRYRQCPCFCLEPARQFMRPRRWRQGGLPVASCALVLLRVRSIVQATALAAARWFARQQAPFR